MALDPRSEEKLLGVRPELVKVIREAANRTKFRVTEGLRSKERQKMLVAQRKSKTMASRHITGHAIDFIAIGEDGVATYDDDDMRRVADVIQAVADEQGVKIERGIDWGWDSPHIELHRKTYPAKDISATRKIIEVARDHPKTTGTAVVGGVEVVKQTAEPIKETVSQIQIPDLSPLTKVKDFAAQTGDLVSWVSGNMVLTFVCGGVIAFFTFLPKIKDKLQWARSSLSS
jgi:peptidoglycan LD-endopeptidase CwlK